MTLFPRLLLVLAAMATSVSASIVTINPASSIRIMGGFSASSGPAHLGQGGTISGVLALDDSGNALVGDGGGNQPFSLIMAFDTTPAFRADVAAGNPVLLNFSTLALVGTINWANLQVSLRGIGDPVSGVFGSSNQFAPHAAYNLSDAGGGPENYRVSTGVINLLADSSQSVDISDIITSSLDLSGNHRIMLGITAFNLPNGGVGFLSSNGDSAAQRLQFVGSSFELQAIPEPSALWAFGVGAVLVVLVARRRRSA